ncbi:MAG: hypothetical protein M3301_02290, partial [Chloroflexota bacterium]|nr:hypothetical protein [Chloroflexota bacterium]
LAQGKAYRPRIDPADFVNPVENPYYPLKPGTTRVYEGGGERVEVTVTASTKRILGVATTVVRDRVFIGGRLAEDTFDWFARDRWANVWYFGEDTKEYSNGRVVSTAGSWQAGVGGAEPGVVMLGEPRVGNAYRQEYYAGEAEDMARVRSVTQTVRVPRGSFDRVLMTEDWTPLEPALLERKWYARGVGLVMERVVRGGRGTVSLVDVRTGSTD